MVRDSAEPRAADEGLGAVGQLNVFPVRESAAQLHQLGVVRASSRTARAAAVWMPQGLPAVAPQRHERAAEDVADRLIDDTEQVIRTQVAGVTAAVRQRFHG